MRREESFYWHDYETSGTNAALDRPVQFAGLRTDAELNIIGEPLVEYCRPQQDVLPHPGACLVTGISPQLADARGLPEREFIDRIHAEFSRPGTCGVGYNTIRFDDEFTRHALYRNFYDPYEREWKNGNSRWDLIDVVRLTYALRPEGIEWPVDGQGVPRFKLEMLTAANGLAHASAHDALSDVEATIALARLIRARQPRLFAYALGLRDKQTALGLLDVAGRKPVLHVSEKFPASNGCSALIVPLAWHPGNRNEVICYDLGADPEPLFALDAGQLRERLYTRREHLPEGVERLGIKTVRLNRAPVLVAAKALEPANARRLNIDLERCERHWQRLRGADLGDKLRELFAAREAPASDDPERLLYHGFLPDADRALGNRVRSASPEALRDGEWPFRDPRMVELLFRYRARNFPDSLRPEEQLRWRADCTRRLTVEGEGALTLAAYREAIEGCRAQVAADKWPLLDELRAWGDGVAAAFGLQ